MKHREVHTLAQYGRRMGVFHVSRFLKNCLFDVCEESCHI